ncbi:uncharacterized protein THITE_2058099 [Thermothielavioides terrestris NRRL 8126]|uniref:Uncharacterized protein n=2 Tax=Thermothielavioides terrestris TaxID=2587410 RepID=G2RG01_THETT|nr:uncharacterized protein THITE_2058099 [Thermothielavioides terrestris NRRL 8126]AEO71755.1 hypothetical protein THITE_2058099 [Thermothielavioides terrestris NRRL 8126]
MATGGCLWFPDLMVADPYHILPVALSAILVLNMLPRSQAGLRLLLGGEDTQPAKAVGVKWRMRLQRALLMVAVFVGPATMDLPAALHLYWIASATVTWAQTAIIWRLMPLPKTVAPAKKSELNFVMPRREEPKRPPMEG